MAIILTSLLSACASIAGDWNGYMECGEGVPETVFALEGVGQYGDRYYGEGTGTVESADEVVVIYFDIDAAQTALFGEQYLDVKLTVDHCDRLVEGEDAACDLEDLLATNYGEDASLSDLYDDQTVYIWDGADHIDLGSEVCGGELDR